jgi:MoaA/NifB/PqqE/SkfB family radical SAM enzyme
MTPSPPRSSRAESSDPVAPPDSARGERTGASLERYRGYLEGRPRLGPETIHLDVTNTCNLDCVTCWNYGPSLSTPKSTAWKKSKIDPALFFRVLDEACRTGIERVVLAGGGEPFTHPQIESFVTAVKQRNLALTIITNGTLCDFDRLAELKVDQLLLNVASATPRTYAAYHPNQPEQTFDKLMRGADRLRGITRVNFVQVINALNAHELVKMVELAHAHGARASFKVGDLPKGTEHFALSAEQRGDLAQVLIPAARARAEELGVRHNLDAYLAALTGGKGLPACFAGYLYTRVSVEGRVYFCCAHLDAGDVAKTGFEQVWSAPQYQAMRERIAKGQWFDACNRCGKHDMNFSAERELAGLRAEGLL